MPWTGYLSLDPTESPRLELLARTSERKGMHPPEHIRVLHGSDVRGQDWTVFFCTRNHCSTYSAMTEATYSAGYAMQGRRFDSWEQAELNEIWFEFTHLDAWMNRSGFSFSRRRWTRQTIKYRRPADICVALDDEVSLTIFAATEGPTQTIAQTEAGIRQYYRFRLRSRKRRHLSFWLNRIAQLRWLLMLATGKSVATTGLEGSRADHFSMVEQRRFKERIFIYYRSGLEQNSGQTLLPQEMTFTYADIAGDLAEKLRLWLILCQRHKDSLGLFFGQLGQHVSRSDRFIDFARAAEIYHRVRSGRPRTQLSQRIAALASENEEIFGPLIKEPALTFGKAVMDTRDYEIHRNPERLQGGHVRQGSSLVDLAEELRILLHVCFLKEMGFSRVAQTRAICRNWWSIDFN